MCDAVPLLCGAFDDFALDLSPSLHPPTTSCVRKMAEGLWLGSWLRFITGGRFAPFVPTQMDVARQMLHHAKLQPGERLVDLGCGDGRLLKLAVDEGGARAATGYEMDAALVLIPRASTAADARCCVRHADALSAGPALRSADVVTLFLSERGNAAVLPFLRASLRPGARVVSNAWEMPPAVQAKAATMLMPRSGVPLHLWRAEALIT